MLRRTIFETVCGSVSAKRAVGGRNVIEALRYQIDKGVVLQIARGGENHVVAGETLAIVIEQNILLEAAHRLLRPQDRFSQGMVLPEILRENLVHQIVGVVLVHLDLFENHSTLTHDVIVVEDRVQHQVGENIECRGDMLIENLEIETDGLFAGECVQVAADGIDLACNALGGA